MQNAPEGAFCITKLVLLHVVLEHCLEFCDLSVLLFFHLGPHGFARFAGFGVLFVHFLDAPQAFMLFGKLLHDVVYVIVEHG